MNYIIGDFVKNKWAPQWGIGKVLNVSVDYLDTVFENIVGVQAFSCDDNPLEKVSRPKNIKKIEKREENTIFSEGHKILITKRLERDEQNAIIAKKAAANNLKGLGVTVEQPDITTGFSSGNKSYLNTRDSLRSIIEDPFQVMVEIRTGSGLLSYEVGESRLLYANERVTVNLAVDNILSWTHPLIQFALAGNLGEPQEIESRDYNLSPEVMPIARAKFSQVLPSISGLYEPGGSVGHENRRIRKAGLKAVKFDMTLEQVKAFVSKMNGMLLVTGAPGSGKTTVGMQRIRFLYDQQELRKDNFVKISYLPELTKIFLANQNLIEHSKKMLEEDLNIPSKVVELVEDFTNKYLEGIWSYKNNARLRRKSLFVYDLRGRMAFYGLCTTKDLMGCWASYENQISKRLLKANESNWMSTNFKNEPIKKNSGLLSLALALYAKKAQFSNPLSSHYKMDKVYSYVKEKYESLRIKHSEYNSLEQFDHEFEQWLFWVYDPFDGIQSYFHNQFYEGGIRIKKGIAGKIPEGDILANIQSDWKNRIYGKEEEPWLAFLLRFVLPEQDSSQDRFREIPNPLAAAGYEDNRWTHVMIDEAQDLCVAEAALLSSFVHPDGAFTVSADFHQVVSPVWGMDNPEAFKMGCSLRDKESYQSFPFAKNMRQSKQIGLFLKSFYRNVFGEYAPFAVNDSVQGPTPLLMLSRTSEFPLKIKQRIAVIKRDPNVHSIALLQINEDEKAMDQIRSALKKLGLELAPKWAASDASNRLITTSTERIKGLEYDACFVIGMDDVESSALNYSKNRAYVALSRPAMQLNIFCEELPRSLQKIEKDFLTII